jgi:hypothetical protein
MLLIFDMLNRKTYHVEFGLEMFICIWYNWGEENDTLPSPLLDLSWVQKVTQWNCLELGARS